MSEERDDRRSPDELREAIERDAATICREGDELLLIAAAAYLEQLVTRMEEGQPAPEGNPALLAVAQRRAQVVETCLVYVERRGLRRIDGIEAFVATLPDGEDRVSARTLRRWITAYEQRGLAGLVPQYGTTRRSSSIPTDAQRVFVAELSAGKSVPAAVRVVSEQLPHLDLPSESAFRRLARDLRAA